MITNKKLKEKKITLQKGDYCLFFSDGLIELMNSDKQMFGEKRLESIFINSDFSSAHELKDIILENINDFPQGAQQHDDITFVVLKAT